MKDEKCGNDDFDFYAGTDGTRVKKERVDIFGDGEKQKNTGSATLPIRRNADFDRGVTMDGNKSKASFIYMILTVLFLTTAFTAAASVTINGMGKDPRVTVGGIAGRLLFGAGTNAGTDTDMSSSVIDTGVREPQSTSGDVTAPMPTDTSGVSGESTKAADISTDPNVPGETPESDPVPSGKSGFTNKTSNDADPVALRALFEAEIRSALAGKKVLVLCTHSREHFQDGTGVEDAARAFCQAVNAVGIATEMCDGGFDAEGRLGAYSRARSEIGRLMVHGEIGLVVDFHIGGEPGLIVGAGADDVWQKNTALAVMVNEALDTYGTGVQLDGGVYNQDLPVLSLHVELDAAERSSRGLRYARILADAVVKFMKQPG